MVRPGKELTTYLDLRTKSPNKKQNSRFAITDTADQDFRKFLKRFKNPTYIGNKIKKFHNEPTEACFFLIKYITNIMISRGTFEPNL